MSSFNQYSYAAVTVTNEISNKHAQTQKCMDVTLICMLTIGH